MYLIEFKNLYLYDDEKKSLEALPTNWINPDHIITIIDDPLTGGSSFGITGLEETCTLILKGINPSGLANYLSGGCREIKGEK